MLKKIFFISVCIFSLTVISCVKKKEIAFDNSDPLALVNGIDWAVVNQPYVAFRTEAGYDKPINAEGRKAEIHRVTGKCSVEIIEKKTKKYVKWYKFEEGWLDESVVDIYNNKYKAETASKRMK